MFNWPSLRALVSRLFGLLVVLVAALAATGLVTYGVAGPQDWFTNAAESLAVWVSAPLSSGAAVLVGVGLVLLAAFLAVIMVPRRPRTGPVLRSARGGTTSLDLASVARAAEHRLRQEVEPTIGVRTKGDRLLVTTPFAPSRPFALVDQAGVTLKSQLEELGLTDAIKYEISTTREDKRRVQ